MMTRRKEIDMLHGPLAVPIILFAVPLALTGILQQLFNTTDTLILGQYVGKEALAAMGNNAPIIGLLVNLFIGLSLGANVVIARSIGSHSLKGATEAVHTSFLLAIVSGVLIAVLGEIFAIPLLEMLSVPESVMPQAALYLRIYLVGMPGIGLYNFASAIYRAHGNTRTPLIALAMASVVNLVFDFVAVFTGFGLAGIVWATVLANYLSAAILFYTLHKAHGILHLIVGAIRWHRPYAREILRIGIPAGVQGMVFSLSNIVIQVAINSLGADYMAASAAAFTIEINTYSFLIAFGQAVTTFISQNYGARKYDRCRSITNKGLAISLVFIFVLSTIVCLASRQLLGCFDLAPDIIEIGHLRILYIIGFYFLSAFIEVYSGALRGLGYSLPPAVLMLITICGARIVWIYTVFAAIPTYDIIMASYPLSWTVTALLLALVYRFYKKNLLCPGDIRRSA